MINLEDSDTASVPKLATVADLGVWRQRASWEAAAEHLNCHGLPAAVPAELVAVLRLKGLTVWSAGRPAA